MSRIVDIEPGEGYIKRIKISKARRVLRYCGSGGVAGSKKRRQRGDGQHARRALLRAGRNDSHRGAREGGEARAVLHAPDRKVPRGRGRREQARDHAMSRESRLVCKVL